MDNEWMQKRAMSPREFTRTIKRLGMTQAGAGRFLGVSERTARRYISGDAEMSVAEVLLLRACVEFNLEPIVPKWRSGGS